MDQEGPAGKPAEFKGDPSAGTEGLETPSKSVWTYTHSWIVRSTHWLNFLFLTLLALSGLRIYWAYPGFARGGLRIGWEEPVFWRFSQVFYRDWSLGGWLAGGLNWHFTFMWFYIITALVYFGSLIFAGRYRHIMPTVQDVKSIWAQLGWYAGFRRHEPPRVGIYNPLQKIAYLGINLLGIFSVVSGLAIYKPTQLSWLTQGLGGYQMARLWHFLLIPAFLLFFLVHIFMVFLHGWPNLRSMITGWRNRTHGILLRLIRREGWRAQ